MEQVTKTTKPIYQKSLKINNRQITEQRKTQCDQQYENGWKQQQTQLAIPIKQREECFEYIIYSNGKKNIH